MFSTKHLAHSAIPIGAFASPRDYWALFKPRVMSLVIFTGFIGIFLAPGYLHPVLILAALICLGLGAAGSASLNMAFEADLDARMKRTQNRPIPRGIISSEQAKNVGFILSLLSVLMTALWFNLLASALLAFTIFFYVGIYTLLLKRSTPQNIVIGGAAGALPPLVGWVCVTNTINLFPLVLFLIIFLWTPPHFWALSLVCAHDYRQACIPMYPLVKGERATERAILIYTVFLSLAAFLPSFFGLAGHFYTILALLLNGSFLYYVIRLYRHGRQACARETYERAALAAFFYSIAYLFFLFLSLVIDHIFYIPI